MGLASLQRSFAAVDGHLLGNRRHPNDFVSNTEKEIWVADVDSQSSLGGVFFSSAYIPPELPDIKQFVIQCSPDDPAN